MKKEKLINSMFYKRGTHISRLAVIRDVNCEENVSIRPLCKIERVTIGKCSSLGSLAAVYDYRIGRFCSIGRETYIGGASHPLDRVSTSSCFYIKDNFTGKCYCENDYKWNNETVIGNDVWIGTRSIILGGINIGDGAVIGAGSVVTKDIGPYEIWAGNPARFIRKRFDDEIIEKLLESQWWEWSEEKLDHYGPYFLDINSFINNF